MKRHIPNVLTCLNLFCGCIASVMVFRNRLDMTAYFVFLAAFFDLFDGMIARKVGANSAFGKELDSLADAVSFGFVPGAVLFKLFQMSDFRQAIPDEAVRSFMQFLPFVVTIFSILRLAKFNLDTRQTSSFIGLPTPANTLLVISLPLILSHHPGKFDALILNPFFILSLTSLMSYLLISEIPLFDMKFKSFDFESNKFQYFLIIGALLLTAIFFFAAIPMIIFLYVILSVIKNITDVNPQ
ncbi:MAG: CDP-diacylglycerol--serine O-phosphatidyltransferase [Bacteroidetes bacterium]|nr:CDP-diacylglycerol--serine O-phosphatidyltransferase [Bacteroidota bacterium]